MLSVIQQGWDKPGWINRLLYPVSLIYAAGMWVRHLGYQAGIFKQHKLPVPVIVVGNLSVGGTGKTPLVMELVERLKLRGLTPGVVSRGYGGRSSFWPREVVTDDSAAEVGDEPILIHRRCQVPVVVGPDRVRSSHLLIAKHRCDIIVSDDGFQHAALRRDLDIVVIDGKRRFGNGWCLPAGPLREPLSALGRAGLIVTNGDSRQGEFAMHGQITRAEQILGGEVCELQTFAGSKVHALAGTGNPGRFFYQLQELGIEVIPHPFRDHHAYVASDLDFALVDRDIQVLMTEKDAIKCRLLINSGQFWQVPLEVSLDPELVSAVFNQV